MSGEKKQPRKDAFLYARTRAILILTIWLLNASYFAIRILHAADSLPAAQVAALADLKKKNIPAQYAAIEQLKNYPTYETAQALADVAVKDKEINLRLTALDQLASIGRYSVVPQLAPLMNDKAVAIRQRAARVIGMLAGPNAEDVLTAAYGREKEDTVKAAIIQALGLCGTAKSATVLASAAQDGAPAVRAHATVAQKRMKSEEPQTKGDPSAK